MPPLGTTRNQVNASRPTTLGVHEFGDTFVRKFDTSGRYGKYFLNGNNHMFTANIVAEDQADEVRNNEVRVSISFVWEIVPSLEVQKFSTVTEWVVRPDKQHLTGNIMLLRLPSTHEIVASATKAKLVQRNIKDEDGMLIAPHELYEKLTEDFNILSNNVLDKGYSDPWCPDTPAIHKGLNAADANRPRVYTLLQDLVKFAPSSLWASHSLDLLLIPKVNEGSEEREKMGDEEMQDGNVTDTADTLLDARPHSRQFLRATESLCAWVTAPWHLMDLPIAKKGLPVEVHVVDLPRAPITSVTPDDLAARWAKVGRWSDEVTEDVRNTLTTQPELLDVAKGATHCEAALVASLARHAPQETFTSEKTTEPDVTSRKTMRTRPSVTPCERNPTTQEPLVLKALFEHLHLYARVTTDTELPLPIGVAKKCCPACAILADIIPKDRGNLVLDLPGSHARWRAWAPPEWLPEHILRELEVELVQALTGMLNQGRPSSPTSPDSPSLEDCDNILAMTTPVVLAPAA
ncbi:hypothetical protein B0H14DRAFT_3881013 [Mycena olivaceomarginata]|nr:hypothetical protein B0H14DRAFT_3881013 [Mycena olivaceomarginata]